MTRGRGIGAVAVAVGLVVAACGGGSSTSGGGGNAVGPRECGLAALERADGPVPVTFWHAMSRANADWLDATMAAFNDSQSQVRVTLRQFPSYQDLLTKYLAGLSTGDLPDLFQPEDTTVQRLIDSQSTMPLQACVDADDYSLDDFLPRATAFYSDHDVLHGMPWSVSNIVLWYNANAFTAAGLDPNDPPDTLAEVTAASERLVASGAVEHGVALRAEPYVFEFVNAKSGATYVNHGNGRRSRATAATLDAETPRRIFTWWDDMIDRGLAVNTGGATGNIDHMLAIGTKDAAMTFEASGNLGTVRQVLETGQYGDVKVAIGALPALEPGGGVPVGDGSLWIPKDAPPARRAAAWQVIKHLVSPQQQAALAAEGGYVPIRTSATQQPVLVERWASEPAYKVPYDQLVSGPTDDATIGPLIGDYQGVRDAVKDGLLEMLTGGASPEEALRKAQREADEAIAAYNRRVGAR